MWTCLDMVSSHFRFPLTSSPLRITALPVRPPVRLPAYPPAHPSASRVQVDKMWGTRYLSPEFFARLHGAPPAFKRNLLFIVAYAPEGRCGRRKCGWACLWLGVCVAGRVCVHHAWPAWTSVAPSRTLYRPRWATASEIAKLRTPGCTTAVPINRFF